MPKKQIAVLCGGQSAEHAVSIESAKNLIQALDTQRYDVSVIVVTRHGEWFLLDSQETVIQNAPMQPLPEPIPGKRLVFQLGSAQALQIEEKGSLRPFQVDMIFPVLHGVRGEDGTLQGLLEMAHIPYVGTGVLGSAVCMDKEIAKRLLQHADISVARWITASRENIASLQFEEIVAELGLPFFVKPANAGSSIGISKVKAQADFTAALHLAQQYDHKILLETYILGREIECAVLGNQTGNSSVENISASLPGEIIPHAEFYSYAAKYLDADAATLKTPAELPPEIVERIQALARKAFNILGCDGMARVDFFLTQAGDIFLNEVNTLPGFTQISQYPYMWHVSGLSYAALLDRLIDLAFARFARDIASLNAQKIP
jgi:D-alanine-D-alanine ligase